MQVNFINLPLTWINPWLGDGMQVSGEALSTQIIFSGVDSGALELKTRAPIEFGAFSLSKNQQPLLDNVTLRINPKIRIEEAGVVRFDLGTFQLLDRYGDVISGTAIGSKSESTDASQLVGVECKVMLYLGLSELLQQPAFAGAGGVLAGHAKVELGYNGAAEYPVQLQASITGLRARDLPGSRQDYRLAAQLKKTSSDGYVLYANLQAGSGRRLSTSLQLAGQVCTEQKPSPFKFSLSSPRVSQGDVDLLMAALDLNDSAAGGPSSSSLVTSVTKPKTQRPPWSDFDGEIAIKVEELALQSGQLITGLKAQLKVSEALLSVKDVTASLKGGGIFGNANVAYDPIQKPAYRVASSFVLKMLIPRYFLKEEIVSSPSKVSSMVS